MRAEWATGNTILLDGVEVARIPISPWSTKSKAHIRGYGWLLRRGQTEYTAAPDGASEPAFRVWQERGSLWHAASHVAAYELHKDGTLASGFSLWRGGVQVGHTGFTGGFPSFVQIDVDPTVPVDDAVLLLWFWHSLAAASQ
ncbi:hypothetical protein Bcav_3894 [Beutenbergia cavernae DSM 12333]|uniref:Uncharacterized protein n=1 Tax=Beutenbergia cavernae (strain ATCC BAA-8 / DSM 12333 / CCUG 43141 / JCM 11478 / NBRC 16432 / NCIMB 13614 / HKI 0122) TaxID=471853 RepID=C5C4L2_BEUC1|nr:hypothetical protein [Beutenbergia cavernae]ACQ82136.1 hypothetical protein Bcav_3894 [Beutenbergia cavernae DSM 12333]